MARAFKSTPRGFVADLEKAERRLLRTLFGDVIQLLDAADGVSDTAADTASGTSLDTSTDTADESKTSDTSFTSLTSDGPPADADPFWALVAGLGGAGAGVVPSDLSADPSADPSAALHREAPQDEALARLLPPGVHGESADEQAAAGEFRALSEDSVRQSKTADLQRAVAALQVNPVVLDEQNAVAFSRALNDVRLVLSARLGIDSEEDAERVHGVDDWAAATDVDSYMALLYNFTTWLLETLMLALSTQLPEAP